MPGIPFIKDFKFDYGTAMEVTPLIRRVVAHNPSPFTFKGTGTYIIGHGKVAIVDPGPDMQDHVDAVLTRLGLTSHFDGVFDIIAAGFEPKPAPQTYQKFLSDHAVDPAKAAMFEDLARNLTVPHQLGMTTVLVVPDGSKEVVREDWELEGRDAVHVDHVTDDLTRFLTELTNK